MLTDNFPKGNGLAKLELALEGQIDEGGSVCELCYEIDDVDVRVPGSRSGNFEMFE